MPAKTELTPNEENLVRRYLIWCYKSTKEELDRIDRKFTQLKVDHYILEKLQEESEGREATPAKSVAEFKEYIVKKEESVGTDASSPNHIYLKNRLSAVEDAIKQFLGTQELSKIVALYETEMISRILQTKDH